jgi:hypothetical protein
MNRRPRLASAFLFVLLLSGCEVDYGDRLFGWVNQNAARVSRESANAELRLRWAQGHSSQALATRSRLQVLMEASSLLHPPASNDSAVSTLHYLQLELAIVSEFTEKLRRVRIETESLRLSLKSWAGICTHERTFVEGQFSRAGNLLGGLPAHKSSGPDSVSIGTPDYLLPRFISDFLQTGKTQKQNERVDEALARAATLSISQPELREFSRVRCEEELEIHRSFITRTLESLGRLEAAHSLAVEVLARRQELLKTRIIPLRIQGKEVLVASEWKRQRSAWLGELAEAWATLEKNRIELKRSGRPEQERLLADDALAGRAEHLLRWAQDRSTALGMDRDPEVERAIALLKSTGARQ